MPFIPHYFPPFLVDMVIELNSQHLRHLTWNIQYIFTEHIIHMLCLITANWDGFRC